MNLKNPFTSLFMINLMRLIMCVDAILIVFISFKQNSVLVGATISFAMSLCANLIARSFSTAYHLLEIKNEYGSEEKLEHANKMYQIFAYTGLICLVISFILAIFKI